MHPIRRQSGSIIRSLLLITLTLGIVACASKEEIPEAQSEQMLYEAAAEQLDDNNFEQGIKNLQMLEARYPFGPYAEQAQLELIYAYYKKYNNSAAIEAAERFIRLHPQHPNVDYAYYMRGLANYNAGKGLFERFSRTDLTERDPGAARQSFNDFALLVSRFQTANMHRMRAIECCICATCWLAMKSMWRTTTSSARHSLRRSTGAGTW